MEWMDLIQWPAMVVTILATWLTGSKGKLKRQLGFWGFLLSNALWIAWGWHDRAWALVLLQVCLVVMNIRGVKNNETG